MILDALIAIIAFAAGFLVKRQLVREQERELGRAQREVAELTRRLNKALDAKAARIDALVKLN